MRNLKQKWQFRIAFVLGLILLIGIGFFLFSGNLKNLTVSTDAFFEDPSHQTVLQLDNFPVYTQNYSNSCGPTTLSMLYTWLVAPINESSLTKLIRRDPGEKGMLPGEFEDYLQKLLTSHGYQVNQLSNVPDDQLMGLIYSQLQKGLPVPIYFSTKNAWDLPNYDTHYSVITGFDPEDRTVTIANAYGYEEKMTVSDFLDAVKFQNFLNPPFDFRLGRILGLIKRNNFYWIEKT